MERARELLQGGERSINDVANLVGYAHASSFCVTFKRYFGTPPRTFRAGCVTRRFVSSAPNSHNTGSPAWPPASVSARLS
jgi:AraC-like DNA-binding protein